MMKEKTFYLQNQETNQSSIFQFQIHTNLPFVNLSQVLQRVPDPHRQIFKIYNPEADDYIPLSQNNSFNQSFSVPSSLLSMDVLIIKYKLNPSYQYKNFHLQAQPESSSNGDNKKERSRQRSILQVIELVHKWRQLHDQSINGRKRTLQQAAKIVGVSKKSLDDYYYQLRVGQKHNFDFSLHFDDKIGVLRAFIKQKEPERKAQGKNSKHPKALKIIQQFSKKLKITQNQNSASASIPSNSSARSFKSESNLLSPNPSYFIGNEYKNPLSDSLFESNNVQQLFWGPSALPISQEKFDNFEKNFYDCFDFGLEDPGDPFLPFLDNVVVKKESEDNQQLL